MVAGSLGAGVELRRWGGPTGSASAHVAPDLIAAPELQGEGLIGQTLVVNSGIWGGVPAPALSLQWLRNGEPIPGEASAAYLLAPADDLAAVACRVTAANQAGTVTAETEPLVITYPAPAIASALPDRLFFQGSGTQPVPTAHTFAGAGLVFAANGSGASVEPASGIVSVPTEAAGAPAAVTVTAANSGGAASQSFAVTVVGAPTAAPGPHSWDLAVEDGVQSLEAAAFFGAIGDPSRATLSYALVAAGAPVGAGVIEGGAVVARADGYLRIEPQTGRVMLDASASGPHVAVAVPIRASNGAGTATATLALTVTIAPSALAPLVSDVAVSGSGACWTPHTVTYAVGGNPAPAIALEWRRNGMAIPGATGETYVPTAADDGATISASVTATNLYGTHGATAPGLVATNPELLVNGDFAAGSAGWTGGGSWQFSAGMAHQNGSNNLNQVGVPLVAGSHYTVRATMVARTSGQLRLQFVGGGMASATLPFMTAVGSYSWTATANPGNDSVRVGGNAVATIDDLSVKRIA